LFYDYKNKERTFFIYTYSAYYIHGITTVKGFDKSHISVFFGFNSENQRYDSRYVENIVKY